MSISIKKITQKVFIILLLLVIFLELISMKNNSKYKDVEIVDDYSMIQVELKNVSLGIPYSLDLYIKNISSKSLAVPNYCFNIFHEYHNVLTNEYFILSNENGLSPEYNGIMMKINVDNIKLSDCKILKPDETIIVNIPNLVNSFNFDEYKYQELHIKYKGFLGESNEIIIKK